MAYDFMMPPGAVDPNALPPGAMIPPPAVPSPVPMMPPPQEVALAPPPQPAGVPPSPALYPQAPTPTPTPPQASLPPEQSKQMLDEEGATAPSAAGDGFFDKLRTDPKMTQAMLMMGMRMMQGNKPGQNDMGMLGDAMMAGATAHNMLSYNEKQDTRQKAQDELKAREANANITAKEQDTAQKAELFPDAKAKIAQEVKNLRAQGLKEEANALIQDAKAGNIKTELDLENRARSANIAQSYASAGASGAAAEASRATTSDKKEAAKMKKWAVEGTEEQKAQARAYFTVDDTAGRSTSATQDANMKLIKMANPTWNDQQVAQEALSMSSTAKANYMAAAQKMAENSDGSYTPEQVQTAKSYIVGQVEGQAARMKPAAGKPAGSAPVAITTEAEWKKLPAGTPYTLNGKAGVR